MLLLSMLKSGGPNTPKLIDTFVNKCIADIAVLLKERNLQWTCIKFPLEQLDDIELRSDVISLLRKYEKHWCLWESFKTSYAQT